MSTKNETNTDAPTEQLLAVTATIDVKVAKSAGESSCHSHHPQEVMSVPEKDMLCLIQKEEEPLEFPLHNLPMAYGPDAQEYEIPPEARESVLEQLYPFKPCPKLTEKRFDIHEQKEFIINDFRVIRERNRNFLVSPFYPHSGGMVVDWLPIDNEMMAEVVS